MVFFVFLTSIFYTSLILFSVSGHTDNIVHDRIWKFPIMLVATELEVDGVIDTERLGFFK